MARLLVVDDDIAILTTLRHLLRNEGHDVDTASNGSEALEKISKTRYDLVILDRAMPVMSGIDALGVLRAAPEHKALPVFMLTSASVTKEVDEAFAAGASGYLLKPLNIPQFLAKVRAALKTPPGR